MEKLKKGDIVKFGSYPQNNGDVKEPIDWRVLEVNGDKALLVSCYGLDCKPFHNECVPTTWKNCSLREWLNHDFLETAFSAEERQQIETSEVVNDDLPMTESLAEGGQQNETSEVVNDNNGNTWDKVFCLSITEAHNYFDYDNDKDAKDDKDDKDDKRRCKPTDWAKAQGVHSSNDGYCGWLLRSLNSNRDLVAIVYVDGKIHSNGYRFDVNDGAVRPALWIKN